MAFNNYVAKKKQETKRRQKKKKRSGGMGEAKKKLESIYCGLNCTTNQSNDRSNVRTQYQTYHTVTMLFLVGTDSAAQKANIPND